MTEPGTDRSATPEPAHQPAKSIHYPTKHVVGVVDTPEQVRAAVATLTADGFADSDVTIACGRAAADALRETTGRTGLAHIAIRVAERIGVRDDEMLMKDRYEQALRDGRVVVTVDASSEERKALAADALREHGGHFVNYLGRFSIETLQP